MPMAALLPALITAGGSIAGGLANRKSARTGENSGTSDTTSNQTNTNKSFTTQYADTTRKMNEYQNYVQPGLYGYGLDLIENPEKFIDPIRKSATSAINRRYRNVGQNLADRMLSFGGSQSGKFGRSMREAEFQRFGDLGDLEGNLASLKMQQQNYGGDLLSRLLNINYGQTSYGDAYTDGTQTSSGTSHTNQTGTFTNPGSAAGGAIQGGLDGLVSALLLNKLIGG